MPRPILWHLDISHFNEKARWALDHKRIEHERRSVFPGIQELRARSLRGGTSTLPVIEIDGRRIGGGQPGPLTRTLRDIYLEAALATA
jgi:glutathione S-transferase